MVAEGEGEGGGGTGRHQSGPPLQPPFQKHPAWLALPHPPTAESLPAEEAVIKDTSDIILPAAAAAAHCCWHGLLLCRF